MSVNPVDVACELFRVLETQDSARAVRTVAQKNYNATAVASPAACQTPGPAGTIASSAWLRFAFPDLSFVVEQSAVSNDTVWLRMRMKGTHTGAFVRFAKGNRAQVIPPTNRPVDVEQIHLVTIGHGQVVRHEALRDDLGMLGQLGAFPPGSAALTMVTWKLTGRAARAAQQVSALAAAAAADLRRPADTGPTLN